MESNFNENADLDEDNGLDILSESSCIPLWPVLKHLETTCEDKNKTFTDKVEVLVTAWQKIVEFILVQPSFKLNEDIFEYAYPQTISVILHSGWLTVDKAAKEHLGATFMICLTYFERFNSVSVINIKSLIKLVEDPWGDPSLKHIISNYSSVSHENLIDFFKNENLLLISTRIKVLIKSKSEDLALLLVNAVVKFTGILPSSWIGVYIRVMTTSINTIEQCRKQNDFDRLKHAEVRLSSIYLLLADVMNDRTGISRELALTAFSLNPTRQCFSLIKRLHRRSERINPNLTIDLSAIPPETGKALTRSLNYDPFTIKSAFLDDCKEVGLSNEIASDLLSIVMNQRYKKLSWMYEWSKLKWDCETYIKYGTDMRNYDKELKYLKIDYNLFK